MQFETITNFTQTPLFDAIFAAKETNSLRDFDSTAYRLGNEVFFGATTSDSIDQTPEDCLNLTRFSKRSSNADHCVYITPRSRSIFSGDLSDVVALKREGYTLYVMDEYEHGSTSLSLASDTPIKTIKEIETGSFRAGASKTCRWDSSFAFIAFPKSWKMKPDSVRSYLKSVTNWMNGEGYAIETFKATVVSHGDWGNDTVLPIVSKVEDLDSVYGYLTYESAQDQLRSDLKASVEYKAKKLAVPA
jgi:hypothetical protein